MSKEQNVAKGLLQFIENSPSVFHVTDNIKSSLLQKGFKELKENADWNLEWGWGYFVIRNDSSVIAFRLPKEQAKGFHMVACHGDSPTFQIKENPEISVENKYIKINTEKYGGMIHSSWLDRPLSVAGRIAVKSAKGEVETKLVNVDKPLLVIPNIAIHMNGELNKGYEYNPQVDMLPLMGLGTKEKCEKLLLKEVAKSAKVKSEQILGQDLFLYVKEKGQIFGAQKEFILSPKLDDLQCVYTSLEAFGNSVSNNYINVLAVFDNEEVGSLTGQGADSTFLKDVLTRLKECMDWSQNIYCKMLADSFLISADNAHGVHPNHLQKADPTNRPYLGGGVVIKYHGGRKYTTDGVSGAKIKLLCEKAKIPYQIYTNRSDIRGGSTLGNICNAQVSLASADIGLPQLSMHSAMETATGSDTVAAIRLFSTFFEE